MRIQQALLKSQRHPSNVQKTNIRNQATPRNPIPKKKLNRNSITVATIPASWPPSHTVPAKIAMQAHWPLAAKSMSLRRPSLNHYYLSHLRYSEDTTYRSITHIGTIAEKKYATPLNPATSRAVLWSIPTELSKITVLYCTHISITHRNYGAR